MTIKYRGFVGNLDIDLETKLIVGKVQNIRAAILYQGETIDAAIADFHAAVDEYLADCEKRGIQPEQSFNGVFQVRVSAETHFALATEAAETSSTLNAVVSGVLERHVSRRTAISQATWSNLPLVIEGNAFLGGRLATGGKLRVTKWSPHGLFSNRYVTCTAQASEPVRAFEESVFEEAPDYSRARIFLPNQQKALT